MFSCFSLNQRAWLSGHDFFAASTCLFVKQMESLTLFLKKIGEQEKPQRQNSGTEAANALAKASCLLRRQAQAHAGAGHFASLWQDTLEIGAYSRKMDATAIFDYFAPLKAWLDEQNLGRDCGWE